MNFKKKIMAMSLVSAMTVSVCTPALAATTVNADVQMNGVKHEAKAALIDGKTYIKVADVKAVIGADGKVSGDVLTLTNGKTVAVTTIDGTQYVTIRDIATAQDYMLGWDDEEKTAVIVDAGKLGTAKFTIMEKYMDYSLKATPEIYKTDGTFNGYVEVVDDETVKVPFSGTMTGVADKTTANVDLGLKLDLKQVIELSGKSNGTENQEATDVEKAVLDALADTKSSVIYNMAEGKFYMKSEVFDTIGLAPGAWISYDYNELMKMSGMATGANGAFDMNAIMELASKGDFEGYLNSVIKSMPVNSVTSYNDIKTSYEVIEKMLGDDAFKLENGQYKSEFKMSDDGANMVYTMTFDTEGDNIVACAINMHMDAEGMMVMDMDVKSNKDLSSTATFSMSMADMMKMYFEMKANVTATTEKPVTAPPAGEQVVDMMQLFNGMIADTNATAEVVTEPASPEPTTPAAVIEPATPVAPSETVAA